MCTLYSKGVPWDSMRRQTKQVFAQSSLQPPREDGKGHPARVATAALPTCGLLTGAAFGRRHQRRRIGARVRLKRVACQDLSACHDCVGSRTSAASSAGSAAQ